MTVPRLTYHRHSLLSRASRCLVIAVLLSGLTACGRATTVAQLQRRSPDAVIAATSANPLNLWARLSSTVVVKGQVGRIVPLVEGTIYQLKDDTGQIWVVTRQKAPPTGSTVQIKGKLRYQPLSPGSSQGGSLFIEQAH